MGTQNSGTNYFWVDNSAVDFINWEDGEPNGNGPDGGELCVQSLAHNGKWNDAACTDLMGYICKIPKIQISTPPPTFIYRNFYSITPTRPRKFSLLVHSVTKNLNFWSQLIMHFLTSQDRLIHHCPLILIQI